MTKDPATVNVVAETAPFAAGPGASEGVSDIDEGEVAGAGEDEDSGEAAGEADGGAETVDGDGVGETFLGVLAGAGAGDWAEVKATSKAAIRATNTKLKRAILEREITN